MFNYIKNIVEYECFQYICFGPFFLLFKTFTNSNIKDISYISLKILPNSLAPFICMMALTLISAMIMMMVTNEDRMDGIKIRGIKY